MLTDIQHLQRSATYSLSFGIFICCLLFTISASAQETDTAAVEIDDERETRQMFDLDRQFDRSVSGGSMTEMGTYTIPSETQYYHPPFEGQKALDRAVDAYLQEMEDRMGGNWYWQFLKTVSPYVKLHLGVPEFNPMQYVDRDNPLFESYKSDEKRQ